MYDRLIDRLILGIREENKEKLISQRRHDLHSAVDISKAMEMASTQKKTLRKTEETHKVNKSSGRRLFGSQTQVHTRKHQYFWSGRKKLLSGYSQACSKSASLCKFFSVNSMR